MGMGENGRGWVRESKIADVERGETDRTYVFNEGTLVLEGVTFAEMVPGERCVRRYTSRGVGVEWDGETYNE